MADLRGLAWNASAIKSRSKPALPPDLNEFSEQVEESKMLSQISVRNFRVSEVISHNSEAVYGGKVVIHTSKPPDNPTSRYAVSSSAEIKAFASDPILTVGHSLRISRPTTSDKKPSPSSAPASKNNGRCSSRLQSARETEPKLIELPSVNAALPARFLDHGAT